MGAVTRSHASRPDYFYALPAHTERGAEGGRGREGGSGSAERERERERESRLGAWGGVGDLALL